jgi:hypothetical protein
VVVDLASDSKVSVIETSHQPRDGSMRMAEVGLYVTPRSIKNDKMSVIRKYFFLLQVPVAHISGL